MKDESCHLYVISIFNFKGKPHWPLYYQQRFEEGIVKAHWYGEIFYDQRSNVAFNLAAHALPNYKII